LLTVAALGKWASAGAGKFFRKENPPVEIRTYPAEYRFITENEIRQTVLRETDKKYTETENARRAELALEKNPFVENAEVYYTGNGGMAVEIEQITPLAYVEMRSGKMMMDTKGRLKPVPAHDRPRLPVIKNVPDRKQARRLYPLMAALDDDLFFKNKIRSIELRNGKIVLHLRGIPPVEMGGTDAYPYKLAKTKEIIRFLKQHNKLQRYSAIDVRYQGQVVCRQ